ncbi:MAG: nucleoside triphosphate pyrophosphohydrolase [Halanaerobiales bacterium]
MKMDKLKEEIERLVKIMETLRGPDGCPWDKEQDYYSLQPYILEEAYEVIETLQQENIEDLKEELGDLLLQVVFEAQIGREKKDFNLVDIIININEKLIRRHPHVFADKKIDKVKEVLTTWEEIKNEEKKDQKSSNSILEEVSNHLPALIESYEIQKKAAEVGFDWEEVEQVIKKVDEENQELKEAIKENDREQIENEIGDLLFAVVNLTRFFEINPEIALVSSILKFKKRFKYIEKKLYNQKKILRNFH